MHQFSVPRPLVSQHLDPTEPRTQVPGTTTNYTDENSTDSSGIERELEQRLRAKRAPDAGDEKEHAVVVNVEVPKTYKFSNTELSNMADNMASHICDIDSLDV